MLKIKILLVLLTAPFILTAQGINFEHGSFDEALAKAKAANKMLFIDGYAVWCGPCHKMSRTTFLDSTVGAYFDEHFVAMKIDVEKGEGPDIKRRYNIKGLPGYVFLDGDGNVVYRSLGYMSVKEFMPEVEKAVEYFKDPNSVGRLAARFENDKNNEELVRMYIDKMVATKSVDYTDVVEHYLSIQTTMPDSSKEMVLFLAENAEELVLGGEADRIIRENLGSDNWKLYVRKDIREIYQKLPKKMLETTTDYAVLKKDSSLIELAFEYGGEQGIRVDSSQRRRVYTYYYLKSEQGEKYKPRAYEEAEAYIKTIDFDKIRDYYLGWLEDCKEGKPEALRLKPHALRMSQNISFMADNYAQFAATEEEKATCLRWAEYAHDLAPREIKPLETYGSILYKFGNLEEGLAQIDKAIEIEEEKSETSLSYDALLSIKESMKKGEPLE